MSEEMNTTPAVETTTQEPAQEAPATEVTTTTEAPATEVTTTVEPELDLDLDFGDEPAYTPAKQQEEVDSYDDILNDLVEKVLQKQKPKAEATEESGEFNEEFLTKKDIADLKAQLKAEMLQEATQKAEATRVVERTIAEGEGVKQGYVAKMEDKMQKLGVTWEQAPDLKAAADLLWRNLESAAKNYVQRPVLTPNEVDYLTREHWKSFSTMFLKGRIKPGTQAGTTIESLSPAGAALTETQARAGETDPFLTYQKNKQTTGKVDALQALKVLQHLSSKK